MTIRLLKKIIVAVFFIFIAILYFHNLTRDVYSGDIGDLVTSAYVFGVAHPPGYPLFSFIGYFFAHLPLNLPVVSKVGLISVISCLAGLGIFYKFSLKVTKNTFLALLSTSIMAFSYYYWLTAEIPEGLALNNLFVIAILYFAIQFYEKKKAKYLYFLSFFVGISLTHQLFIITLLPAILFLIIKNYKFLFSNKKRLITAFLFFLGGLIIYIYIPIAASRNPVVNWDNAVNLKNFLHLVFRNDYGGITHTADSVSLPIKLIFVSYYFQTIISVFSYQILFVVLLGLIGLLRKQPWFAMALLIGFLLTGPVCFFVTAAPIFSPVAWGVGERYYSVSIIVLMFTIPYGFLMIKDFLDGKFSKTFYSYVLIGYFLIIPVFMIKYNFPKTDLSKTQIGNSLATNILNSLPKNSVLFVSGDNTTFTIWYARYVLKIRPDIDIINQPGVGNDIFINKEINAYYAKNPKVPLNEVLANTVESIRKNRHVFSTGGVIPITKDTILVPKGLIFEIVDKKNIPNEAEFISENQKIWKKMTIQRRATLTLAEQNFIAAEMPLFYSRALVNIGNFISNNYHDPQKAESYYAMAAWIDDTNSVAYSGLALSLFQAEKNCDLALKNIDFAITLYPIWKPYYDQKLVMLKNCQMPKEYLNNFKSEYRSRFNQNINKLFK